MAQLRLSKPTFIILSVLLGSAVLAQAALSALVRSEAPSVVDAAAELLASYDTMQFDSARKLQRQLISERTRHSTAVRQLRHAYRTSTKALRQRMLELRAVVTGGVPSHMVPNESMAVFAGRFESIQTEVAADASSPNGRRPTSIGTPRPEPSTSAGAAANTRTLLQEASAAEPSCSMDELMAVQADPMAAVIGLFTTNPDCATCIVPCGGAADAVSCAMGCLKQARGPTRLFRSPQPGIFVDWYFHYEP